MNIPVKVTPPARVRRPWILGAIIAALLAVAAVISLYEFSPEFRLAVAYKPVDKQLCAVENVNRSIGKVTVKCYEKRIGWGYMLVTSDGVHVQVDRPVFQLGSFLKESIGLDDDVRRALESYVMGEVITEDVLREMMSWWCGTGDYNITVNRRSNESHYYGSEPIVIAPDILYFDGDERYTYFTVSMWGMDRVYLTLDRATGEITACAPTVYAP